MEPFKDGVKYLDLNQSVHELCRAHPEVADILAELGFTDITKPGMLSTAGRFVTISQGARMRGIELTQIKQRLRERGFETQREEQHEQRD